MTNQELINKLKVIAQNPDSVSLDKLTYIVTLLHQATIEAFWNGKINYQTMISILTAGEE